MSEYFLFSSQQLTEYQVDNRKDFQYKLDKLEVAHRFSVFVQVLTTFIVIVISFPTYKNPYISSTYYCIL